MKSPVQSFIVIMATQLKRVQIEVTTNQHERLDNLKTVTGAASYSEVIKSALKLYEAVTAEKLQGNRLVIKTKHGLEKEIILL